MDHADFIFRTASGDEVARAATISEFIERIKDIPIESVEYHSANKHFTPWLTDHQLSKIAKKLEKEKGTGEGLRKNLLKALEKDKKLFKGTQWI